VTPTLPLSRLASSPVAPQQHIQTSTILHGTPQPEGSRLAELYARWGRHIVDVDGTLFAAVDPGSRVYAAVVDHGDYCPSAASAARELRRASGFLLRYPTTSSDGLPGGAYVCTDQSYDFGHLHKRMRNYVRRGQEACTIRPLQQRELLQQGLRLNKETDGRHGRRRSYFCDAIQWQQTVHAVYSTEGAFCLGAFVQDELASYQIGVLDGEWAYALIQMSRTDLLEHYPNHALDFAFNQWAFAQPGISGISIGPRPLHHNEGLHNYKLRMGFEVTPRQTKLQVHPAMQWCLQQRAVRSAVSKVIGWAEQQAGLQWPAGNARLLLQGCGALAR
jgi:hypothetical protein